MSSVLNDRIGEQGLLQRHCSEIALRAHVNHLEDLPAHDAGRIFKADANGCGWGVRKNLISADGLLMGYGGSCNSIVTLGASFVRIPVTLPIVFQNLIAP